MYMIMSYSGKKDILKKRILIAMTAMVTVLCMIIFVPGVLNALNRTGAEGAGEAKVAKWSVDTQFDNKTELEIKSEAGSNVTYELTVKNESETADIIGLTLSGLPDGVAVDVKENETSKGTATFSDGAAVLSNVTTLDPGGTSKNLTVCFTMPQSVTVGNYTLTVEVTHTQID